MTLAEAAKIRDLLDQRERLEQKLKEIENCVSITGDINCYDGAFCFRWAGKRKGCDDEPCPEIQYIIAGYKAAIAEIDATLEGLPSSNIAET